MYSNMRILQKRQFVFSYVSLNMDFEIEHKEISENKYNNLKTCKIINYLTVTGFVCVITESVL